MDRAEYKREWARKNRDRVRRAQKAWLERNPEKRKQVARDWARRNPEKAAAWNNANPEASIAVRRQWMERNPEKRKAHIAIAAAIRSGQMIKPSQCIRCASTARLHGHHPDYNQPLAVEWLCSRCHRLEHAEEHA